jgi:ADP-ribose pyrophosphatase YjhB (NUDIX family)
MNDYIQSMRRLIGHETLITVGCGAIVEDSYQRILLQRRKAQNNWCLPGGVMEIGETFLETLIREVQEETDIILENPTLFGIYSGPRGYKEYPNGDKVYSLQMIFHVTSYHGNLRQEGAESYEHVFFDRDRLPHPLNENQEPFIRDWAEGKETPIVR